MVAYKLIKLFTRQLSISEIEVGGFEHLITITACIPNNNKITTRKEKLYVSHIGGFISGSGRI